MGQDYKQINFFLRHALGSRLVKDERRTLKVPVHGMIS